jgi:chaperone required for assembly of F1-ATPase
MRELFEDIPIVSVLDPKEAVRQTSRGPTRKRFYSEVTTAFGESGYQIMLDRRPIRTPSRAIVTAPSAQLAEAIAGEWRAQIETIDPTSMPLTRLANSVTEGVTGREQDVAADIVKYLGTDLLCYRAGHPSELVARESEAWDGVLFWASEALGAHFILAQGLIHAAQPESAVRAAAAALPAEAWPLAGCHVVTTITGSALLALALWHGARTADQVWTAAHVDEDWNIEQWGVDEESAHRRAAHRRDFDAAARVIEDMRPR